MSCRSHLSREELEVHQALSETDSESVRSAPLDPGQRSSESGAPSLSVLQNQVLVLQQQLDAFSGVNREVPPVPPSRRVSCVL